MTKEFKFSFEALNVLPEDLTALLGFEEDIIPEPFPEIIELALSEAAGLCNIRGGYKIFDQVEINQKAATIKIGNSTFSPSKIVTSQLKDANSAALFVCTAGEEISNYANKVMAEDPMLSYVFDIIGSVSVEKAMDKIQELLYVDLKKTGLTITDRYSPGYCNWSVAEQQYLFSLIPENFCGISLSDSSLMHPIKSVSGIIGIGKNLVQKGYQCQWCRDKSCIYGNIKRKRQSLSTP